MTYKYVPTHIMGTQRHERTPAYLFLSSLVGSRHGLVTVVCVHDTLQADDLLVRAAEHLQQLVVLLADLVLELGAGVHQLVPLGRVQLLVAVEVALAVGVQAHQAGPHRLELVAVAHAALHVVRAGHRQRRVRGLLPRVLQLLHHLGQHGVPAQHGPRGERLPALGAAVHPSLVLLVPAALDAAGAVAVSAGEGDGVPQQIQTHRTAELVLGHGY